MIIQINKLSLYYYLETNLWLENDLVNLLYDPDELSAVNALHKGVTDILSAGRTQWTHNRFSSGDGALGTESLLQSMGINSKELGSEL